jgi:hypothetical protein
MVRVVDSAAAPVSTSLSLPKHIIMGAESEFTKEH